MLQRIFFSLVLAISLRAEEGFFKPELTARLEPKRAIPAWSGPLDALRKWGDISQGLQMATYADVDGALIYVWIRNAMSRTVKYNTYYLGYFDYVHLEIKQAGYWQRLKRRPDPIRFYAGAGPDESDDRLLESMQLISTAAKGLVIERFRSIETREHLDPQMAAKGFTVAAYAYRDDLSRPFLPNTTYMVDLADFAWPAEFLKGEKLTLRVVQEEIPMNVTSVEMEVSTASLNAFFKRLNRGLPLNPRLLFPHER